MRTYLAIFFTVLLAELGDKTQLATLVLAASPNVSKVALFAAAGGALVLSTLLAVLAGALLSAWLPPRPLRVVAAVGFIGIGLWMLVTR